MRTNRSGNKSERCVMGLDMYLNRKTYAASFPIYRKKLDAEGNPIPVEGGYEGQMKIEAVGHGDAWPGITAWPYGIEARRVKEVVEEVAYWRKANQIHHWFVVNVQDGEDECQESDVSREQLQELVDVCREVLADHSKAEDLLPSAPGFFFGSTEYDDRYFQDVADTVEQLERVLAEPEPEPRSVQDDNVFGPLVSYSYRASW